MKALPGPSVSIDKGSQCIMKDVKINLILITQSGVGDGRQLVKVVLGHILRIRKVE